MEGVAAVGNLSNGITPSIGVSPMRLSLDSRTILTNGHFAPVLTRSLSAGPPYSSVPIPPRPSYFLLLGPVPGA